MRRLRGVIAATVLGAAVTAPLAGAQTTTEELPPPTVGISSQAPATQSNLPAGIDTNPTPPPAPKPAPKPSRGGTSSKSPAKPGAGETDEKGAAQIVGSAAPPPITLPTSCGPTGVPAYLLPTYQRASQQYELGAMGPSILAAINEIESGFGANLGPSSAGAVGWMQFMPSTWASYGVDANGDGRKDPNDPEDAIFAAASYLRASGMPDDPEGAVFSYNHADWYVADVMARAACFSGIGDGAIGGLSLIPKRQELVCSPAQGSRKSIPDDYMKAFQAAAGRYEVGQNGVWALAAVARIESNFGRGMTREQLKASGPLGISDANWAQFAVDGDGDGRVTRASASDSASTVARMIWAGDSIRAGLFQHNHAEWYVQAVLNDAEAMAGKCQVRTVAYAVALPGPTSLPINWANVELSNSMEMIDIQSGAIDGRILTILAAISQDHTIQISSLRSDHSMETTSGNISNHYYGRAMDIAAIDGVPCTEVAPEGPCGTIARQLGALPPGQKPTELIYCFDPDGPAPEGFARADHCDHVHVGFDS